PISRKRIWGMPVPVFHCKKCKLQYDPVKSIDESRSLIRRKGFDWWLKAKPNDILPDGVTCETCGTRDFRWGNDVLDTKFMSAMIYRNSYVKEQVPDHSKSLYTGTDIPDEKNFQLSLIPAFAIEESVPFDAVFFHRYIKNDKANDLDIKAYCKEFSVDVFRLWVISIGQKHDSVLSRDRLDVVNKFYRCIRNTCRFLLSNISDYNPQEDSLDSIDMRESDRWILNRIMILIKNIDLALNNYNFHRFYNLLHNFFHGDASDYINITKRRLYTLPRWSMNRRSAQTAIYEFVVKITKILSVVIPYTAEDIWRHIPGIASTYPSVFMSEWPEIQGSFVDHDLLSNWDTLFRIRQEVHKVFVDLKDKVLLENSLKACVTIYPSSDLFELLDTHIDDLENIFGVSQVRLMQPDLPVPDSIWISENIEGLGIEVKQTPGDKCERCWIYSDTVGSSKQHPSLCFSCIAILEGGTHYI
ncbi:class I tRNA ligase family protein, partial [Candidatus Poribacteria bacterium]|nr:class I tRNA ligase family protein [Candidatus Poribacteria bacterium]